MAVAEWTLTDDRTIIDQAFDDLNCALAEDELDHKSSHVKLESRFRPNDGALTSR